MHRITIIFAALAMLSVLACNIAEPDNLRETVVPAFAGSTMDLTSDADRAVTDRPITMTGTCTPLVRGKGRLLLEVWPNDTAGYLMMESPSHDTLRRIEGLDSGNLYSAIYVDFTANAPISGRWTFRLPTNLRNGDFTFSAYAVMDSVFLADSNKMLWYDAEAVRRSTKYGDRYNNYGISLHPLILYR